MTKKSIFKTGGMKRPFCGGTNSLLHGKVELLDHVCAVTEVSTAYPRSKIFPGFRILLGSKALFIPFISSINFLSMLIAR